MLNSMLIRGGRVIDPANGIDKVADAVRIRQRVNDVENRLNSNRDQLRQRVR